MERDSRVGEAAAIVAEAEAEADAEAEGVVR